VNNEGVGSSTGTALTAEAQRLTGGALAPPLLQPEKYSRWGSSSQSPHPFGHLFPSTAWFSPHGMEKVFSGGDK